MSLSDYECFWAEVGGNEQDMMWEEQEWEADIAKEDDDNDSL